MSITLNISIPILEVNKNAYCVLNKNDTMSIGTRVKQARKDAGLTQKELAAKIGVKQETISQLETGVSAETTKLGSMENALKVRAYWIETGLGPKKLEFAPFDFAQLQGQEIPFMMMFQKLNEAQQVELNRVMNEMLSPIDPNKVKRLNLLDNKKTGG